MLNNSYFIIYNNSFNILHENLKFYINENLETFKKHYELKNSKKITGYMLFVRDYYKEENKNKKKEISEKWNLLTKEEKKKYNEDAKEILKSYNKLINKEEKVKKIEKSIDIIEEIEDDVIDELSYDITEIEIDNKKYYIDCNRNIIDIDKEKYIGYLDKTNKINLFN